jgi:adenosylcobinamide-phosphate synthase
MVAEVDLSVLAPTYPVLLGAVALDALFGDPTYRLHPVRLIGKTLSACETMLRAARFDGYGGGCALLGLLILIWVAAPCTILLAIDTYLPWAVWPVLVFLVFSLIALGDLIGHGWAVEHKLLQHDLTGARQAVSRLVGRDTQQLDAPACRRAVIESLAESLVDGFISPLFWYTVLGLPGLLLFKVVSTMDSMVGYKTPRYLRFGWCGARSDDLMNWLPARLTWLLMTVVAAVSPGTSAAKAFRIGWQQHALVPGPNSGWSEAATAGALQHRLVGPIWQEGMLVTDLWLGDPHDPPAGEAQDFTNACRFIIVVGAGSVFLMATLLVLSPPTALLCMSQANVSIALRTACT